MCRPCHATAPYPWNVNRRSFDACTRQHHNGAIAAPPLLTLLPRAAFARSFWCSLPGRLLWLQLVHERLYYAPRVPQRVVVIALLSRAARLSPVVVWDAVSCLIREPLQWAPCISRRYGGARSSRIESPRVGAVCSWFLRGASPGRARNGAPSAPLRDPVQRSSRLSSSGAAGIRTCAQGHRCTSYQCLFAVLRGGRSVGIYHSC